MAMLNNQMVMGYDLVFIESRWISWDLMEFSGI